MDMMDSPCFGMSGVLVGLNLFAGYLFNPYFTAVYLKKNKIK